VNYTAIAMILCVMPISLYAMKESVKGNNSENVLAILKRHPEFINDSNGGMGLTPLHVAARAGLGAMMSLLIEKGADIEALCGEFTTDQHTPLYIAIVQHYYEGAAILINHGARINDRYYFGSLLHLAELFGDIKMAEILLMAGISRDIVNDFGKTPLEVSKQWNKQPEFGALLENFEGPALCATKDIGEMVLNDWDERINAWNNPSKKLKMDT